MARADTRVVKAELEVCKDREAWVQVAPEALVVPWVDHPE